MTRSCGRVAVSLVFALAGAVAILPPTPAPVAADEPPPAAKPADPALNGSAIAALVEANGGKPPATGEELWQALGKIGKFAQLPVMFSAVRLDSGLGSPRVVMTPTVTGLSEAGVTAPNLNARLFLAANMERDPKGGDPRVTLVEFISWNTLRRRFDFGVIENMGGGGQPELKLVDGGRCFACHKNRGPILGAPPWSNTSHDDIVRLATAAGLRLDGANLPESGPFVLPKPVAGKPARERIDGMALAIPEAADVDLAVRLGAALGVNRDTFRLLTRTPDGRKALVGLLSAVVAPGPLDPDDRAPKIALDNTLQRSFVRFATDWLDLQKAAKPSVLIDADPAILLIASGIRPPSGKRAGSAPPPRQPVVRVPGLRGGSGSRWAAAPPSFRNPPSPPASQPQPPPVLSPGVMLTAAAARKAAADNQAAQDLAATLVELVRYESARSVGFHGLISQAQPSNPQAFLKPAMKAPARPSGIVGTLMLANTIGLTEGDRKFLADALLDAAKRVNQPKVTAATLARAVFEGPEFAELLAGGPLPDRDEFKDLFVAGLHHTLTKDHPAAKGFTPDRREYASGPRYDRKLAEEVERAVVPTTACLRCHDVRPAGKSRVFEPIPALAFDPLDKRSREAWVAGTSWERRPVVLARMIERLYKDADMPPQDSPEHEHFRVKEAAAFAEAKTFLEAELARLAKKE